MLTGRPSDLTECTAYALEKEQEANAKGLRSTSIDKLREEKAREILTARGLGSTYNSYEKYNNVHIGPGTFNNINKGSGTFNESNGTPKTQRTYESSKPGLIQEDTHNPRPACISPEGKQRVDSNESSLLDVPIPKKKKLFGGSRAFLPALFRMGSIDEAKAICEEIIAENESACEQNYQLVASCDSLRKEKDEQHSELLEVRRELGRTMHEATVWEQKHTESEERAVHMQRHLEEALRERDEARCDVATLRGKNTVLDTDRTTFMRERDEARCDVVTLRGQNTVLDTDRTVAFRERDEARADMVMWRDRLFQGWRPNDRDNKRRRKY